MAPVPISSSTRDTTLSPRTPIEKLDPSAEGNNRFIGRLFKRVGSGHQFNQHYLDNVFEMEGLDRSDLARGRVKDGNSFMDAPVDLGVFEEWDTVVVQGQGKDGSSGSIRMDMNDKGDGSGTSLRVKDLSRLWAYRNGGSPD